MRFLICGLGSIGRRHLKILENLGGHEFTALRSGKNVSSEKQVDKEIHDIKDAANEKTDAALITNPTSMHIETAAVLAKLGIPLFIEKPLGKDLEGIDELVEAVKENNVPVLMGYNFNYHPAILYIKEQIQNNSIGKIISARAQFGTYMPDWHKNEDHKKSYAALKELGGGVVLTSIHEQNYLTGMFGEITNVKAMEVGGSNIGIECEEGVEIIAKHKSGVTSNVHLNFFQKPYYRELQVIGTDGTIYWNFMKPEVKILKKDVPETIHNLGNHAMHLLEISYINQMKHFMEVVKRTAEPEITLDQGINDMKVALEILKEIGRN